ncbi:MAG: NUDIX hydrolase [Puniceicoccales bacterium]|nr:NUDIX hydrolase [Puniceicoccales bacterium]
MAEVDGADGELAPWERLAGQRLWDGLPLLAMDRERWRQMRSGREGNFYRCHMPSWVQIVPVDEDGERLILVRQFRFGMGKFSLETPGGAIEPGESPLAAAQREFLEETGYGARSWQSLASLHPFPAFCDNLLHVFLATGCRRVSEQHLDPFEEVAVVTRPMGEVYAELSAGKLSPVHVAVALLLAKERLGLS